MHWLVGAAYRLAVDLLSLVSANSDSGFVRRDELVVRREKYRPGVKRLVQKNMLSLNRNLRMFGTQEFERERFKHGRFERRPLARRSNVIAPSLN